MKHNWFMQIAFEEAQKAYGQDEVPVGAVIVSESDKIIWKSHNLKEKSNDPFGHAEILAMREAAKILGSWRLSGCRMYVTLEPCPMCMAAVVHARLSTVIFGAYDLKAGALSLGYKYNLDKRLNHNFAVCGGVMDYENSKLLSQFFREKRQFYRA